MGIHSILQILQIEKEYPFQRNVCVPSFYLVSDLTTTEYDIAIIGGGCTGSMIALDAALRGYKVVLFEKGDFASGTSSRSTNLLHGGVRYLESAFKHCDRKEFSLVREALYERRYMLQNAPYLTRPIATVLPATSWFQMRYMQMGLWMYDILAWRGGLPRSHTIKWKEIQYLFPNLDFDWIKGGVVYYDGQSNDSRLNAVINRTAMDNGASCLNYMEVVNLLHSPCEVHHDEKAHDITEGVVVRDVLTKKEYAVRSKVTVNAAGPFVDSILQLHEKAAFPTKEVHHENRIVPSKGVHLLLRGSYCPKEAGVVTTTSDNRVLFILPWQNYTLIGTTDSPCSLDPYPEASQADIDWILKEISKMLVTPITQKDILAVWCGIRPLVRSKDTSKTSSISRSHEIWFDGDGFITIAGGKWTTVRNMAQDVCDIIGRRTKLPVLMKDCKTKDCKFFGANEKVDKLPPAPKIRRYMQQQVEVQKELEETFHFASDIAEHLSHFYGYRAYQIASIAQKENDQRLHSRLPYLQAEVMYCIRQEMALRLSDIVLRRLRIGVMDTEVAMECLPTIIELMKKELHWDTNRCIEEVEDTVFQINKCSIKKYDIDQVLDVLPFWIVCSKSIVNPFRVYSEIGGRTIME